MSNETRTIFGLKEDSRPKGAGCLYMSRTGNTDGQPLAYFDLYKTSDEQFRAILLKVLPKILSECRSDKIELVNFKLFSADIFRDVASEYTDCGIVVSESADIKMHL